MRVQRNRDSEGGEQVRHACFSTCSWRPPRAADCWAAVETLPTTPHSPFGSCRPSGLRLEGDRRPSPRVRWSEQKRIETPASRRRIEGHPVAIPSCGVVCLAFRGARASTTAHRLAAATLVDLGLDPSRLSSCLKLGMRVSPRVASTIKPSSLTEAGSVGFRVRRSAGSSRTFYSCDFLSRWRAPRRHIGEGRRVEPAETIGPLPPAPRIPCRDLSKASGS